MSGAAGGDDVEALAEHESCHRCGGSNVVWYAPSPLWNLVMRGNDINGSPRFDDLVCIPCFVVLAAEAGVGGIWRVSVDPEPDGLVKVTPSGRVWDASVDMWVEPSKLTPDPADRLRAEGAREALEEAADECDGRIPENDALLPRLAGHPPRSFVAGWLRARAAAHATQDRLRSNGYQDG